MMWTMTGMGSLAQVWPYSLMTLTMPGWASGVQQQPARQATTLVPRAVRRGLYVTGLVPTAPNFLISIRSLCSADSASG
jgi:hypothetical protein